MDKDDIEYLKEMLKHRYDRRGGIVQPSVWYASNDSVISVANILDSEGCFSKTNDVIYYFEKPWKWETDMQEVIDDNEPKAEAREGQ